MSGNTASGLVASGGGMLVVAQPYLGSYGELTLTNSILWNNGPDALSLSGTPTTVVEYSLVEGGWPGAGNIDADPVFVDPLNGNYRLMSGSPCIDAANNLAVPPGIWTDLDGKLRFIDDPLTPDTGHPGHLWPIVDMGAYEFGVEPPRKVRRR